MLKLSIKRRPTFVPSPETDNGVEVWRDVQGTICAYGQIVGDNCWMHLPGLASFRLSRHDTEHSVAFTNSADDDAIHDAYRRRVLPMALQLAGREVMHASAVRSDAGVIAFCAASETGKSTIAFGLYRRGYSLWADDAVAFDISSRQVWAAPIPFEMRLRPSAAKLFGGHGTEKSIATLHTNSATKRAPLLALCVLRRKQNEDDETVSVRQLYSTEALEAVLCHAWCFTLQDVERKRLMMANYLELIARTSVFDVSFRAGLENLPVILDAIESHLQPLTIDRAD